ncbi:MAG: glycosyltransferase family 9 protein [Planctomycetaceae bacterium]
MPHPLPPPPLRRLGILRLSAIGDVIHSLPLAMGLRRAYPEARITWVAQENAALLLRIHPAVDEVLVFPRHGGPRAWWRFAKELRARRFDAVVDPQGNAKSGVIGLLSGAPVRAGLALGDCKEWVNALCTNRRGPRARGPHGIERAWAAGAALGVGEGPDEWGLHATPAERQAWRTRAESASCDPDRPILALAIVDPRDVRAWPLDLLGETAAAALQEGWQVVLNGPAARAQEAAALRRRAPGACDLTGRDDWRGLLAQFLEMAMRRGSVLLAPDSGPLHLACAAGLPVVCLSGPQDPRRTGPRQGEALTAWEGLTCAPCRERSCRVSRDDPPCMRAIAVERVLASLRVASGRSDRVDRSVSR